MSILFNKTLINDSFCICPEDKDLFETTSYKSTSLSLNLNLLKKSIIFSSETSSWFPYVKFSLIVPSIIKGVTPTYPNFFDAILMFPLVGMYNPLINPRSVLFPDPFGPVIMVWVPLLISKEALLNIFSFERR